MMWMREPLNVEVLPNACHLIQKSFYCKERPKLLVKSFLQHLKIKNISNRNFRFHSVFEVTDLRNLGKLRKVSMTVSCNVCVSSSFQPCSLSN